MTKPYRIPRKTLEAVKTGSLLQVLEQRMDKLEHEWKEWLRGWDHALDKWEKARKEN